jgi:hypothetical protein
MSFGLLFGGGTVEQGYQRAHIQKFVPSGKDLGVGAAC